MYLNLRMIIQHYLLKSRVIFIVSVLMASQNYGFEDPYPSIITPQEVESDLWTYSVSHRFYGALSDDPIDTAFGMDSGANTIWAIQYMISDHLNVMVSRESFEKRYQLDIKLSQHLSESTKTLLNIEINSSKSDSTNSRQSTAGMSFGLRQWIIHRTLDTTINLNYAFDQQKLGFSVGNSWLITEDLSLFSELYPVPLNSTHQPIVTVGTILKTFGHRFLIFTSNSTRHNRVDSLNGAPDNTMHLGFKIIRLLGG